MPDLSSEEKQKRWEQKKVALQKLIKEHQHEIYNPNVKGSVTSLSPTSELKHKNTYIETSIFPVTFNSSKEARLMLSWMDSYTEMYNVSLRYIKAEIEKLNIVPFEKDTEKLEKKDEILNARSLRDKLKKEKNDIKLYSNLRFYEKVFHFRTKEKGKLVHTHTLDMAIRKCCSTVARC